MKLYLAIAYDSNSETKKRSVEIEKVNVWVHQYKMYKDKNSAIAFLSGFGGVDTDLIELNLDIPSRYEKEEINFDDMQETSVKRNSEVFFKIKNAKVELKKIHKILCDYEKEPVGLLMSFVNGLLQIE